jgi:ketosteroid isomerase-like protein
MSFMNDAELISFVESLDRSWLQGRLQDLSAFLAEDVVFVSPGGTPRVAGLAQAIEGYRQFTSQAQVHRFQANDYFVTRRGDTAVVEYAWQMTWVAAEAEHNDMGRDVLVLARRDENWRVVWRTQIPIPSAAQA